MTYSVIPKSVDVDNLTINKNTAGQIQFNFFKPIAQNAYNILKSSGSFNNIDSLISDNFSDSNGANNTVNTGSSTAVYGSGNYGLSISSYSNVKQDLTQSGHYANNGAMVLQKTLSSVNSKVYKHENRIWSSNAGNTATCRVKFIYNDTTSATVDNATTATTAQAKVYINPNPTKIVSTIEIYESNNTASYYCYEDNDISYKAVYNTSNIVICDVNTILLSGGESKIFIYGAGSLETNTNIKVDISDGTTTISNQNLNELIDISSLSSGTLKITFNLSTTNSDNSPILSGYGVVLA